MAEITAERARELLEHPRVAVRTPQGGRLVNRLHVAAPSLAETVIALHTQLAEANQMIEAARESRVYLREIKGILS